MAARDFLQEHNIQFVAHPWCRDGEARPSRQLGDLYRISKLRNFASGYPVQSGSARGKYGLGTLCYFDATSYDVEPLVSWQAASMHGA